MPRIEITQGKYALVDYEDYTGLIRNRWCISDTGYAKRGTKSKGKTTIHYMHRQIMDYPKGSVDHINGDKLDNRKSNLRVVDQSVNGHNRKGLNKNNTSGYRGIWYDKYRNAYVAEIWVQYRKKSKRFQNLKDAIIQRKSWEDTLC